MTTILVLDGDLGFVAYVCMTLTEAGYTAVPATKAERALPLLQELGLAQIDLLIVNLNLPGALDLVEALRSGPVKVVEIEEPNVTRIRPVPVDGMLRRSGAFGPTAEAEWLRTVRRVLGEAA